MTVTDYIKTERTAGRFPNMPIDYAAGRFWLCDNDWKPLDGPHFESKAQAEGFRSLSLDRTRK